MELTELPASTVLDDFPNFSNMSCLVHLYVDMDQFLRFSIRDEVFKIVESSFWVGVVGVKIAGELVQEDKPVGTEREYGHTGFVCTAGTTLLLLSFGGVSFNISCILVLSKLAELFI
jgi:hypothetical protein